MAETDRRIQETSKLGTTLVQQRVNLGQRLQEIGSQEEEAQISPELRQKLVEIEREYNEVGRQSARAFLGPKSEAAGDGSSAPFALDGKNLASPTKFSSQATDSPSKVNVPRKQRNQASRTDDIDFAAEISTSLLGQVRHLQAVLLERDETLKAVHSEKSRLEVEAEGFSQRLRSLDESEQRYKDENWNLETQLQEINAAARESASREHKLQQVLAATTSEKSAAQSELDHLRQDHGKISEDYVALRKTHDSELASLRKNVNISENEKETLQQKIEELTSQNRELANGLAGRFRDEETEPEVDAGAKFEEYPFDLSEREHSPPPSPTKGVHRHSMLESETLKSSLNHAHRMIQNLKGNVHREKAEKQDLKRMLQEARDELEIRRAEPGGKRLKAKSHTDMRRAGRPGLGATRNSRTDIMVDDAEADPEWEDHNDEDAPRGRDVRARPRTHASIPGASRVADNSDAYQTANETEDAFETANERDTTDNDAFQTGAESLAGDTTDEAEATETESGVARGGTIRSSKQQPTVFTKPGDRRSVQSTASTSDEDEGRALHTPNQNQPQRYRLKVNRNSRRSRVGSEVPGSSQPSTAKNSPASFMNGGGDVNQSLFNELENLSGGEDGTPSKGTISSPKSTPSLLKSVSGRRSSSSMRQGASPSTIGARPSTVIYTGGAPPIPKIPMVDSSMMTEPMEPLSSSPSQAGVNSAIPDQISPGLIESNPSDPGREVTQPTSPSPTSPRPGSSGFLSMSSAAAITSRIFGSAPQTPQNKGVESQPASASNLVSDSRSSSISRRPAWDQPLQMFGMIPGFNQSADSTPLSTKSITTQVRGISGDLSSDDQRARNFSNNSTQPTEYSESMQDEPAVTPVGTASKARAPLTLSPIHSLESAPVQPIRKSTTDALSRPVTSASPPTAAVIPGTVESPAKPSSTGGILGSVFGWNKRKVSTGSQMAEDETRQEAAANSRPTTSDSKRPLQEVPANTVTRNMQQSNAKLSPVVDRAVQTLSFSDLLDTVSKKPSNPSMRPLADIGAASPGPSEAGRGNVQEQYYKDSLGKSFKRPISTTSMRSRAAPYPPLPPDHQEAIAAAAQKAPPETPTTSTTSMGPPLAPASAYPSRAARSRSARPQTPSQQGMPSPSSRGGTTPRAGRYSTARSQASRRSSFSSFASELDERFNIRTDAGMPMPQGLQPGTDPRMIQAITQTMIGEMMWKYTRKAGRGEMSSTRHRRFFWVHPYTRTLYWSDRDPATANRAELKSKSVAIEAVRVVTDDNHLPPGLHRKSLIIITPGRSVKFTAQTSQRHETWFNALSYLLLRTGPDGANANPNLNPGDLSDADVAEFNPGSHNKRSSRSRVSLSSFRSSATQNRQDHNRLSTRIPTGAASGGNVQSQGQQTEPPPARESVRSRISRSLSRNRGRSNNVDNNVPNTTSVYGAQGNQGSVSSRISNYWHKPSASIRSSMRSRTSLREDGPPESGVVDGGRNVGAGRVGDSAEDLRRVIENQEQGGRLENVRACCDGRHDVGSLAKSGRHHSHAGSTHSTHSHRSPSGSVTNLAYG